MSTDGPADHVSEANGVRVTTTLESQVYHWNITNLEAPVLDEITLPVFRAYDCVAPPGWHWENVDGLLTIAAREDGAALEAGESMHVQLRANSAGPVVRESTMTLQSSTSAEAIDLTVLAPGHRHASTSLTVATTIAVLALVVFGLAWRRQRSELSSGK